MKLNEAKIFIFIASVIIGLMLSINMGIGKANKFLDVEQYEDAYNERRSLQNDIYNLQKEKNSLEEKIRDYEYNSQKNLGIISEIANQHSNNLMALGLTAVKGEGVKIVLEDAEDIDLNGDWHPKVIHNSDIIKVINDLRSAGAEAISINGYRVMYNSSIVCWSSTINMDGIKLVAPFTICAIGNKDVFKNFIENHENQTKLLMLRKCRVNVEYSFEIKIPAYTGKLKTEYMKEATK